MYHAVQVNVPHGTVRERNVFANVSRKKDLPARERWIEACLAAFVAAGTLGLSLDRLARSARTSKRMLIHYFGSREALEELAMARLEDRLRTGFRAGAFPRGTPLEVVVRTLWDQLTAPRSRGILLLSMDLTRRSWSGSVRGRRFFEEQQRLWSEMLQEFLPDPMAVETLLQLFQGAALVYLATGNRDRGRGALERLIKMEAGSGSGLGEQTP
jgi:AcrR family transcriptional regulator